VENTLKQLVRRALVAGFALALAAPIAALAQAWPAKPIRIIVPYTPGGSSDIIARSIQQPLQDALKQTVIVENKPGANGNTGTDFVAKSPPDGYTLLLCDVGALAITSSVYSKLPFDPAKDLVGVTIARLLAAPAGGAPLGGGEQPEGARRLLQDRQARLRGHRHRQRAAPCRRRGREGDRRALGLHPVQGRLAGDRRHRRRPDAGA
jgi:hypothetical protein